MAETYTKDPAHIAMMIAVPSVSLSESFSEEIAHAIPIPKKFNAMNKPVDIK